MKTNLKALLLLVVALSNSSNAQVCATPAKNGDNLALNGTVNSYWTPANGTYNSASTSISISSRRGATTNIASGDLVLVIQMQCATINFTDTQSYGDGNGSDTEFGSPLATGYIDPSSSCLAGRYEYVRAGPSTSSTSLDLSQNPLTNIYVQAVATNTSGRRTFQVIRVPQYNNATLTNTVTTVSWDGFSGGVVALDVAGTLSFGTSRTIDVDGQGFRGGGGRERSVNDANIRYRWDVDDRHASKGEGIVGTPRYVSEKRSPTSTATAAITDLGASWGGYPTGSATNGNFARGAPGTAGGGGNFWDGVSDNGGGGAGGNGGAGGRGGAGWQSAGYAGINANYSNITQKKWGFGGSAFSSSISRVAFGSGGGAGDNNLNSAGPQFSSGAAGGGIVMIRAREIIGTGTILARGARGPDNPDNDATGAGGAGGSVILVSTSITGTITVTATGGRGGDSFIAGTSAHGPGGGGGGGVIYRTGTVTANLAGGANGITNTTDSPPDGVNHGAKPGGTGVNTLITVPTDTPGINTGFRCLDYGDAQSSYGLASHNLNVTPNNLRIGSIIPDGDASLLTSIPSTNANFDDLNSIDDEDGVTLPSVSSLSGEYTAAVVVRNNSGVNANLCGWMDFNQDGIFQSAEGVCSSIVTNAANQNINLVFTVPISDRNRTGKIVGRFRLTTESLTTANSTGQVDNGEVEDHFVNVTTLPVSVHNFNSSKVGNQLSVNWSTSSETQNAGFNLWGVNDGALVKLNQHLIPTKNEGVLKSTNYSLNLNLKLNNIDELALTATDIRGNEDLFGYYQVGKSYGRIQNPDTINWENINTEIKESKSTHSSHKETLTNPIKNYRLQVKPLKTGMQQLTYEELLNFGFDLTGVNHNDIAVSVNGEAVSRFIGKNNQYIDLIYKSSFEETIEDQFGPEDKIEFWTEMAEFPEALYLDFYNYEVSINSNLVSKSQFLPIQSKSLQNNYLHQTTINEDNYYAFTTPSKDPWYAKRLINFGNEEAKSYNVNFEIDSNLMINKAGTIEVTIAGGTDMPEDPDHELGIIVNNQLINTTQFNGAEEIIIKLEIPQGFLRTGDNSIELKLTEGTQALYDVITVDKVILSYPRLLIPIDNTLLIDKTIFNSSLLISHINPEDSQDFIAYQFDGKNLNILETNKIDLSSLMVATDGNITSSYWISLNSRLNRPELIAVIEKDNLIENNIDYLIVTNDLFLPNSQDKSHPLNDYILAKSSEGYKVKLVSIKDIQNQYKSGMNLPDALKKYLIEFNKVSKIEHVLLVGSDTYDYKNNLELGSVSFIPTKYSPTVFIPHTPSDALLTDLNNDGLSDIAIGRWPVRTIEELGVIVNKTLNWSNSSDLSAIFITDIEDDEVYSFESQATRMIETINNLAANIEIVEIFPNLIEVNDGETIADKAREILFEQWQRKYSLTNFIGHGSPTQWSRQGILTSSDLEYLTNTSTPTLIGTLTCYSSYFVSPETNSLALNLINGINSSTHGAIAIHGAATLSSYSGNEVFADIVLKLQLQGETLGKSIIKARIKARALGYNDQVINWTLLGDPTLKVHLND